MVAQNAHFALHPDLCIKNTVQEGKAEADSLTRRYRWRFCLLDGLWLLLLALYVFAGRDAVPFHGDESSHLYLTRDYHRLVVERDLDAVLYRDPPPDPDAAIAQDLRLANGTVTKYVTGLAWDLAGLTVDDINGPWAWLATPASWQVNSAQGHMPGDGLLRIGRTVSTLFTIASVSVVFALAWQVAGRPGAWAASLIYATTPAVLLNGRRAMLEGALLFTTGLVVLVALLIVRARAHIGWYAALGVCSGLAVASKHTGALTVLVVFAGLALDPVLRGGLAREETVQQRELRATVTRHWLYLIMAGLVALGVFLALTPAWWSQPLHMPGIVIDDRRDLLDAQADLFGRYEGPSVRTAGLLDQAFFAEAQFYEVPVWEQFIGDEIADYRAGWLDGRGGDDVWGVLLVALFAVGVVRLGERWHAGQARLVLLWIGLAAALLLVLTPMAWQRYYLPLQAPVAVIAGAGVRRLGAWLRPGFDALKRRMTHG
jgi:hypothetical protein